MTAESTFSRCAEAVYDAVAPDDCGTIDGRYIVIRDRSRGPGAAIVLAPRGGSSISARVEREIQMIGADPLYQPALVRSPRAVRAIVDRDYVEQGGGATVKDSLTVDDDRTCKLGLQVPPSPVGEESSYAPASLDLPLFLRCPFRHPVRRMVWPLGAPARNGRSFFSRMMGRAA